MASFLFDVSLAIVIKKVFTYNKMMLFGCWQWLESGGDELDFFGQIKVLKIDLFAAAIDSFQIDNVIEDI